MKKEGNFPLINIVLFDKNGVILKFEQPNMAKPEPIEKYFDRIEEIKKRLF